MISIEVRDEAQAEIPAAFACYEDRRQGLGQQFLLSLDAVFERIRRQPMAFPVIDGPVRHAMLRRFPYALIFDLEEDRRRFHVSEGGVVVIPKGTVIPEPPTRVSLSS